MAQTRHQHEGPEINGQPTLVTICSTDQLRQSIYLPSLLKTINTAFYKAHTSKPELRMDIGDRLGSTEHLLATLTQDPESFIMIISHTDNVEVLATASCRRYLGPPGENMTLPFVQQSPAEEGCPEYKLKIMASPFLRRSPVEAGSHEWELKMMATHPTVQGQGFAGYLMSLAEKEIIERSTISLSKSPDQSPKDIKIVISTPTELNGAFYARKGYQKDYENERGAGYDFHIIFMSKIIGRFPGEATDLNDAED